MSIIHYTVSHVATTSAALEHVSSLIRLLIKRRVFSLREKTRYHDSDDLQIIVKYTTQKF